MVVAQQRQSQARSMGDMLAALSQSGRDERKAERRSAAVSQVALCSASNRRSAGRYNKIDSGNEDEADQRPKNEEELRRVPLLVQDEASCEQCDSAPREGSRWKSCRWLDECADDGEQDVRRAPSKRSLMESLFSHSSGVLQLRNCPATRRKKSVSGRDKFQQHLKAELFCAGRNEAGWDGDDEHAELAAANDEKVKCSQRAEDGDGDAAKVAPALKCSQRLLSLLSHNDEAGRRSPLQLARIPHQVVGGLAGRETSLAQSMASDRPATRNCLPMTDDNWRCLIGRREQQEQVSAQRLASSSPFLSAAPTGDNYDATRTTTTRTTTATGDCFGSSNKERNADGTSMAAPATCNKKLSRLDARRTKQQSATRAGDQLMKLPRAERARTQRRRQHTASQRDLLSSRRANSGGRGNNNEADAFVVWPAHSAGLDADRSAEVTIADSQCRYADGAVSEQAGLKRGGPAASDRDLRRELELANVSAAGLGGREDCAAVDEAHWNKLAAYERGAQACAKNNASELSSELGLADNGAARLAATRDGGGDDDGQAFADVASGGRRREADNHPDRRAADVGQMSGPARPTATRRQLDARRTVTNAIAPLACQLGGENANDVDSASPATLNCLAGETSPARDEPSGRHCAGGPSRAENSDGNELVAFGVRVDSRQFAEARESFNAREAPKQMTGNERERPDGQHQMHETFESGNKSVRTRLVDTCASSWRQAALMASPVLNNLGGGLHSGSYKVAQQQQQQQVARDNHSSQTNRLRDGDNDSTEGNQYGTHHRQEVRADTAYSEPAARAQQVDSREQRATSKQQHEQRSASITNCGSGAGGSQRRLSRPGRSPISLQRQTNARLARHRLKIQQQRQEQLASLALREREQLARERNQLGQLCNRQGHHQSSGSFGALSATATPSSSRGANDEIQILTIEEAGHQRARTASQTSTSFLSDLIERLSGRRSPQAQPGQHQLTNLGGVAFVNFGLESRPAPRASRQPSDSVAIQICDNEPVQNSSITRQASSASHRSRASSATISMHQPTTGGGSSFRRQHPNGQMALKRGADSAATYAAATSLSSASSSASSSTLSLNKPFCKICHLTSTRNGSDKLISPCKCSGTMQYIHCGCLLKWLEISNRTNDKPISCELCAHEYTWHKRFNYQRMKLPKCSTKDILLHMIFVLALAGMLFCALAPLFNRTIKTPAPVINAANMMTDVNSISTEAQLGARLREMSFGGDPLSSQASRAQDRSASSSTGNNNQRVPPMRGQSSGFPSDALSPSVSFPSKSGRLANDEKFILVCAAFFFISFFIAIYAQTKTRDTLYGLIVKFTNMNLTYYITEYDHGTPNNATSNPTSVANTATVCDNELPNECLIDAANNATSGQRDFSGASQNAHSATGFGCKGRASKQ